MTDAVLLACPSWCDGVCGTCSCDDDSCRLLHTQRDTVVEGVGPEGKTNAVLVALERRDTAEAAGTVGVHLDLEEHDLHLTLAATRELGLALLRIANQGGAA